MSGALALPILFLIILVIAVQEATARTASLLGELQHPVLRQGRSLPEIITWLSLWVVLDALALSLAATITGDLFDRLAVMQVG